jgi:hypothetical protein
MYYADNTVFGENYESIREITCVEEGEGEREAGGESSAWAAQVTGGCSDDIDPPPAKGWLVAAYFHTLWNSGSVACLSTLADIVPSFSNSATFLSVRADAQSVIAISKKLKIKEFPTVVLFRKGEEIDRISGEENFASKFTHMISQYVDEDDRVAHAKRRERLRQEKVAKFCIPYIAVVLLSYYFHIAVILLSCCFGTIILR